MCFRCHHDGFTPVRPQSTDDGLTKIVVVLLPHNAAICTVHKNLSTSHLSSTVTEHCTPFCLRPATYMRHIFYSSAFKVKRVYSFSDPFSTPTLQCSSTYKGLKYLLNYHTLYLFIDWSRKMYTM